MLSSSYYQSDKMKFTIILSLVLAPNIFAGHREDRIIGGHESKPHSHPYLASLQLRFLWTRFRLCSGSLLNHRWILTAGHCVKSSWIINWLTMEAILGTHNVEKLDAQAQRIKIAERIAHPLYEGDIGPYDIGMVRTEKDVIYTDAVYPIELPYLSNERNSYDNLMIAGWGALRTTFFIPDLPDTLQEADVKYIPYDVCKKAIDDLSEENEPNPLDKKSNICTGPLTGGIAGCSGDSGGPLIQFVPNPVKEVSTNTEDTLTENQINDTPTLRDTGSIESIFDFNKPEETIRVVVGIVSWGVTPCGEVGAPTIYTNVSAYMDFINMYLYR